MHDAGTRTGGSCWVLLVSLICRARTASLECLDEVKVMCCSRSRNRGLLAITYGK